MKAIYVAIGVAALCYFGAFLLFSVFKFQKAAKITAFVCMLFNFAAIALRTILTGRLNLSSTGDFILLFVLFMVLLYLLLGHRLGRDISGIAMLGASILLLLVLVAFPEQLSDTSQLPATLKSPLLYVHVITAAASYGLFALAAFSSCAGLLHARHGEEAESRTANTGFLSKLIAGGFSLLTLTIILGAIWAEQAWGSYWSWDPKETWSLVTWIVYAVFLHQKNRLTAKQAAVFSIVAFAVVIFTFFGVNYLLAGLHSYA